MSEPGVTNASALRTEGLGVSFGAVQALIRVDLDIRRGEVAALVGANGAGKSTLLRVVEGDLAPSDGRLYVDGDERTEHTITQGMSDGIAVVRQQLDLVPGISVGENIFLGAEARYVRRGRYDRRAAYADAADLLDRVGLGDVRPEDATSQLTPAQQQLLALARALRGDPAILLLDEPTSTLTPTEAARLLEIVSDLRTRGIAIVFVSHRLDEVLQISDRVLVLRDGQLVADLGRDDASVQTIVAAMGTAGHSGHQRGRAGGAPRDISTPAGREPLQGVRLEVDEVQVADLGPASFTVAKGEILGLFGLMGGGQSAIAQAIAGVAPPTSGRVRVEGNHVDTASPRRAQRSGVVYSPEDRRGRGIHETMSVWENVVYRVPPPLRNALGFIRRGKADAAYEELARALGIKAEGPSQPITALSGGNQQKCLLARCLLERPSVLVLHEPAQGIDIIAKEDIYDRVRAIAAEGTSIVYIATDVEELQAIADRVLVIRHGCVVAEVRDGEVHEGSLIAAASSPVGVGVGANDV